MAGAEPDFFYPFSDDCKNFMTQRVESAYVFSLHIGLHVSCYSLMTIPWHEDFCKWCAEIFQILIVCDSPHCATASLTTSNAKHFPRRRESNL